MGVFQALAIVILHNKTHFLKNYCLEASWDTKNKFLWSHQETKQREIRGKDESLMTAGKKANDKECKTWQARNLGIGFQNG